MTLSAEPGSHSDKRKSSAAGPGLRPDSWVTFTPMAFNGLDWSRIAGPQRDPRAACLLVTAYIHLFQPGLALRELDARAEPAIRELEEGAPTVMVIDDRHRIDRTGFSAGR